MQSLSGRGEVVTRLALSFLAVLLLLWRFFPLLPLSCLDSFVLHTYM